MKKLLIFLLISSAACAQLKWDGNNYTLESGLFVGSGANLPFWMRSQTYGEVPVESQFLQMKGSLQHEYDSTYNLDKKLQKFGFGHGASLIANVGKVNQFLISEAYLKGRAGFFELWAGRRKETIGLVDSSLSSGSLIWGGNALPMPKIQIEIPNYTPILGRGLISIKGTYAHGWFGSTDSLKNYLLHQKTFYTRLGRPHWKFKFFAGFNHQVQWAGTPTEPFYDPQTDQIITTLPKGFATYFKVVSGISLNRRGDQVNGTNGVPFNEAFNRAGNHLGTLDIALEYEFPSLKLFIYRQSLYEDGSLYYLNNISDGLLGISLLPKKQFSSNFSINKINVEYLDSKSQGGSLGSAGFIAELRGRDNYFNNGIYKNGWTYAERSLANAYFLPLSEYSNLLSNDERFVSSGIFNNRLSAINLSLDFDIGNFSFLSRYSSSRNLGNYGFVFDNLRQDSFYFISQKVYNKYTAKLAVAIDRGDFLGNQMAINACLIRRFYQ